MTSSIKPKVNNISVRRQRRTEQLHEKFDEDRTCSSEDVIADRQTHTDTLITILCFPVGRGVKSRKIMELKLKTDMLATNLPYTVCIFIYCVCLISVC